MISPQVEVAIEQDDYHQFQHGEDDLSSHGCRCKRCMDADRLNHAESHLKRTIKKWFLVALGIGWAIIIGYLVYYYWFGPSSSERLDILVNDPNVKLPGTPALYSKLVRTLGERTGWASNQRFSAWYNSHAERVHASYSKYYGYHGMGHPRMYERGGGMNVVAAPPAPVQ